MKNGDSDKFWTICPGFYRIRTERAVPDIKIRTALEDRTILCIGYAKTLRTWEYHDVAGSEAELPHHEMDIHPVTNIPYFLKK